MSKISNKTKLQILQTTTELELIEKYRLFFHCKDQNFSYINKESHVHCILPDLNNVQNIRQRMRTKNKNILMIVFVLLYIFKSLQTY